MGAGKQHRGKGTSWAQLTQGHSPAPHMGPWSPPSAGPKHNWVQLTPTPSNRIKHIFKKEKEKKDKQKKFFKYLKISNHHYTRMLGRKIGFSETMPNTWSLFPYPFHEYHDHDSTFMKTKIPTSIPLTKYCPGTWRWQLAQAFFSRHL